ncbi:MAG: hypothetical protein WBP64_01055 [Nitrososphaeraceae archaeon]
MSTNSEKTVVFSEEEKMSEMILNVIFNGKTIDICGDCVFGSKTIKPEKFEMAIVNAKTKQGVKVRYLAEITNYNLAKCKELMQILEVHHLDMLERNFVVTQSECYISVVPRLVYSNVREIVDTQQLHFNLLWNKSVDAKEKIRMIEEGQNRRLVNPLLFIRQIFYRKKDPVKKSRKISNLNRRLGLLIERKQY